MSIKNKLLSLCITLAVLPVLLVTSTVAWYAYDNGRTAIEEQAKAQLTSIRDIKKQQIESYFQFITQQVQTLSNDRMIINAMKELDQSFGQVHQEASLKSSSELKNNLSDYYNDQFGTEFKARNNNQSPNINKLINPLDEDSIAMQYLYITTNDNPLGEKDALIDTGDNTDYAKAHALYHPHIRDYLLKFEYYDIFLVSPSSGDIIYSVFKELDFSTSLIDGPYANSGIGEAFRQANESDTNAYVYLSDFSPYLPSYNDPAAFIASPILDNGKKIGILIFQMPIDKINDIMTHEQNWASSGLGTSGETYLVGGDYTMRSMSRFLLEDPTAYFELISNLDSIPQENKEAIEAKSTSIGLQPVKTQGSTSAIEGEKGFAIFPDYRNVNVLSAYSPLDIEGLQWVIMSEIDQAEAFRHSYELKNKVIILVIGAIIITLIIATACASILTKQFTAPLDLFSATILTINQTADLSKRIDVKGDDEIARSAKAINSLLQQFQDTIQFLIKTIQLLKSSSHDMAAQTAQLKEAAQRQETQSQQVATASRQMATSANEVAKNAEQASTETYNANDAGKLGSTIVKNCIQNTETLTNNVSQTHKNLDKVADNSRDIDAVLQVIQDIAEQTNLLALNAAIEAARAGEQGRGFAVVADEVRTLAQRTRASTEEIKRTIDKLQNDVNASVSAIEESTEQATISTGNINELGTSLSTVTSHLELISSMNEQIASAATEQLATADDISNSILDVSEASKETSSISEKTAAAGENIEQLATQLQEFVSKFKA